MNKPFNIDPPVACTCHWDGGHEPHCAIVAAHDARFLKNNVDKQTPEEENVTTMADLTKLISSIKDSLQIVNTGKDSAGNSYNNIGRINQAAWIGEHVGPVLEELERQNTELDKAVELLAEADYLYTNYGLVAQPVQGKPLRIGHWISSVRDFLRIYGTQAIKALSATSGTVTGRTITEFPSIEQCVIVVAAKLNAPVTTVVAALLAQAKELDLSVEDLVHRQYASVVNGVADQFAAAQKALNENPT